MKPLTRRGRCRFAIHVYLSNGERKPSRFQNFHNLFLCINCVVFTYKYFLTWYIMQMWTESSYSIMYIEKKRKRFFVVLKLMLMLNLKLYCFLHYMILKFGSRWKMMITIEYIILLWALEPFGQTYLCCIKHVCE